MSRIYFCKMEFSLSKWNLLFQSTFFNKILSFFIKLHMCHCVIDTFYLLFFENLYRDFTLIAPLFSSSPIGAKLCSSNIHFVSRMPFSQKLRLLFGRHMNIDLCRLNGAVSQQLLDIGNIHLFLQQVGGH